MPNSFVALILVQDKI